MNPWCNDGGRKENWYSNNQSEWVTSILVLSFFFPGRNRKHFLNRSFVINDTIFKAMMVLTLSEKCFSFTFYISSFHCFFLCVCWYEKKIHKVFQMVNLWLTLNHMNWICLISCLIYLDWLADIIGKPFTPPFCIPIMGDWLAGIPG